MKKLTFCKKKGDATLHILRDMQEGRPVSFCGLRNYMVKETVETDLPETATPKQMSSLASDNDICSDCLFQKVRKKKFIKYPQQSRRFELKGAKWSHNGWIGDD